jgi:hypothetical protein
MFSYSEDTARSRGDLTLPCSRAIILAAKDLAFPPRT